MAFTINQINVASNATLQVIIDQVNKAINAISKFVLTVNVAANGALDTGADYPNQIYIGNSSSNTFINSSSLSTNSFSAANFTVGNILANTTVFQVGANVKINTSVISFSSNTTNTTVNSSAFAVNGINVATIANRATIAKANTLIGSRGRINFIEGTNIALDISDDSNGQINVIISSLGVAGNSQPGGANSTVQFNDGGSLAGDASLIWDKTSKTFTSANGIAASQYKANCVSVIPSIVTFSNTATNTLDSFILLNYRTVEYTISVTDNNGNNYQASKILVTHNGGSPIMTEYAQLYTNSAIANFSITSNTTHGLLKVTPVSSANVTYKLARDLIEI